MCTYNIYSINGNYNDVTILYIFFKNSKYIKIYCTYILHLLSESFHEENMALPSSFQVWRMNIAYMLGLSCSSGNGTNIKMLMPCSTNWGPWDKIWKFLRRSLWAPINIIIITTTATTFACQWMVCKGFEG